MTYPMNASLHASLPEPKRTSLPEREALCAYVKHKWEELTRSRRNLYFGMLEDDKVPPAPDGKPIVYISMKEDFAAVRRILDEVRAEVLNDIETGALSGMDKHTLPEIDLRVLPEDITAIADDAHGLLYVPNPYVVPGGRFNEFYGWDSAFIFTGLILDGEYDKAKAMTDNQLYCVDHYGTIPNANRSYYLGRSQPPFLTQMVLGTYHHFKHMDSQEPAAEWLRKALLPVLSYYHYWTSEPFLEPETGLSYYNDLNEQPGIEVTFSEQGHYDHALNALLKMKEAVATREGVSPEKAQESYQHRKDQYYLELFLTANEKLSPEFYRGDRAMRASGFDPSRRFGFFNVDIIHHLPVCLNTLLYLMELEIAEISEILLKETGDAGYKDLIATFSRKAKDREQAIQTYLWDNAENHHPDGGDYPSFRDYNFRGDLCAKYNLPQHRNYQFAASFYPLWAGLASEEQAKALVLHLLPRLLRENGLMTSDRETGSQWDAPFAWAPLQVIAVRGLLRYGYEQEALAIAHGFLHTVWKGFEATGKIFEKYDVEAGSHNTSHKIDKGYNINVEGFGWTNAAVLEFTELLRKHEG